MNERTTGEKVLDLLGSSWFEHWYEDEFLPVLRGDLERTAQERAEDKARLVADLDRRLA